MPNTGQQIRQIIIEQSYRAHIGHIGSALSLTDILAVLNDSVLRIKNPEDADRDRFILSKGHAALVVYAALFLKGWISQEELNTFCADDSLLGSHPTHEMRGIDFSTGSLGQGITYAVGAALAAKLQGSQRRVFAIVSDAECNEGSLWEAAMFAAHHKLSNLVVIVDLNGQQALGYTPEVINMLPMEARWRSFDWDVHDIDGHDTKLIQSTIESFDFTEGLPHVLVAHTTFGKGVSFMENKLEWHYLPLSEENYSQAQKEISGQS